MHYVAVIDKDPDSAWGARFPEVPGCFSASDTFEEIVPNAIEALSLFFEDSEPMPRAASKPCASRLPKTSRGARSS